MLRVSVQQLVALKFQPRTEAFTETVEFQLIANRQRT